MKIADRYIDGHVQRRIDQLRIADQIDLEGDPIADPHGDRDEFIYEFAVVEEIGVETPQCTRVVTTQGAFGQGIG